MAEFLDRIRVFLGFLRARATDRGVQVLVSHLHIVGNIIVIFLEFLEVFPKVKIPLFLGGLLQECVLGGFCLYHVVYFVT